MKQLLGLVTLWILLACIQSNAQEFRVGVIATPDEFCVSQTVALTSYVFTTPSASVGAPCTNVNLKVRNASNQLLVDQDPIFPPGLVTTANPIFYTPTAPGIYNVIVESSCQGGGTIVRTSFSVLDTTIQSIITRSCQGREVTLTLPTTFDGYVIDWGDGTIVTQTGHVLQHIYPDDALRSVAIQGVHSLSGGGSCGNKRKVNTEVSPIEALKKSEIFRVTTDIISNTTGEVTIDYQFFRKRLPYRLEIASTSSNVFLPIDTLLITDISPGVDTISKYRIGNINTATDQHIFRLVSFDNCGNSLAGSDVYSILTGGTATSAANTITWLNTTVFSPYQYTISVNGIERINVSTAQTDSRYSYNDTNVRCRELYTYRSTVQYTLAGMLRETVSGPFSMVSVKPSNVGILSGLHSTFENANLELFWQPVTLSGVKYYLYTENTPNDTILFDSTSSFRLTPRIQRAACYVVKSKDLCGTSPPSRTCPSRTNGRAMSLQANEVNWSSYVNGDNAPIRSQTVEWYDERSNLLGSSNAGENTFIHTPIDENNQVVYYRVRYVIDDSTSTVVYSNVVSIKQLLRLWVPSAFSPNGDGLNDTFFAKGLFFNTYEVVIFNRWGEIVYSTRDLGATWDGGNSPPGEYQYRVRVTDAYGDEKVARGTLQLTR